MDIPNVENGRSKSGIDNYITATGSEIELKDSDSNLKKTRLPLNLLTTDISKDIDPKDYVEGEVIVKYKEVQIDLETLEGKLKEQKLIQDNSLNKIEELEKSNISVLTISDGKTVEQKIEELEKDSNIEYAEPNYKLYPATINSNDPNRSLMWGLDNIGQTINGSYGNITGKIDSDIDAPEAWGLGEGTNIIVAVIDSGVAYNHPDILANMWNGSNCKNENGAALGGCLYGYDFENNDKDPFPTDSSHGTHVAGIIAAAKNNSKGIVGVAPQTKIMALRFGMDTASEVRAINFAIQNGAKIINASYGNTNFSQSEYDAINSFKTTGGIFITASGNQNTNNENVHFYPSDYTLENIISVAATDQNDNLASFSNYGATSVDVGAPGTNILSTVGTFEITLPINETFESITPPRIPSGFSKTGNWGTYYRGGDYGNVLYSDLSTPYANNANTTFTSPKINLSSESAVIDFWTACDTEYLYSMWDYMTLEFSSDGVAFTPEFTWDEVTLDDLNGDYSSYGYSTYHISNYEIPSEYLTSNFKFRFKWITDFSGNDYEGCFVDDIKIAKNAITTSGESYEYMDGTSMAAPYVAGLVALIRGYNPSLSITKIKDVVLTTGDASSSLAGKTVSGKRINAYNALISVNPTKQITSFSILGENGVINETSHTIKVTVPFGTDVTALTPTINITGLSISPLSGVSKNFTSPVTYTVTAAEGSTQNYIVTVEIAPDPSVPVLTLSGSAMIDTYVNSEYIDEGATAVDLEDGVITENIVVGGDIVDSATIDQYIITYNVTDSDGNTAIEKTRTVNVIPIPTPTPPSGGGGGAGGGGGGGGSKNVLGTTTTNIFPDVDTNHTFQLYIKSLKDNGVIGGFSDGNYYPDKGVTRGQMAKFIVNAFKLDINTEGDSFPDVDKNDIVLGQYIQTLKNLGIIGGFSDGTYRPDMVLKRGEATKFIVKALELKGVNTDTLSFNSFSDVSDSNIFIRYIALLSNRKTKSNENIIGGYADGTFKPDQELTRGAMAKIIWNSMQSI